MGSALGATARATEVEGEALVSVPFALEAGGAETSDGSAPHPAARSSPSASEARARDRKAGNR